LEKFLSAVAYNAWQTDATENRPKADAGAPVTACRRATPSRFFEDRLMCSVRPIRELEITADGRFRPTSATAKNKFLAD
jgi:hypothetical protein